jgi:murein DD-endopeptidase MepM/ murein hydrolase activator NlpD
MDHSLLSLNDYRGNSLAPLLSVTQSSMKQSILSSSYFRSLLRFIPRGMMLTIVGFLVTLGIVFSSNTIAQAFDQTQNAMGGSWLGASFPVENFQTYTSPFGYRSSPDGTGSSSQFHRGLDMAAPEGSYIRSWWTGKVVEVSDNSACGTSVVIESGQWEHVYCHMIGSAGKDAQGSYIIDREGGTKIYDGQTIQAGTRIGRVGMTGRTTGPHLHWGLKYASQWVDPALVLRAMYAEQNRGQISAR